MTSKIRVLIVEDSPVVAQLLQHVIAEDPRLEVVGIAVSGEEAIRKLNRARPQVISMDIRLPGIDGLETTKRIMRERPTPIVIVTSSAQTEDLDITIDALRAGALSVVEKPRGHSHGDYARQAKQICTQLAIMSDVAVVSQRPRPVRRPQPVAAVRGRAHYAMLGIVASTGGPRALGELVGALPQSLPLPVVVVQHMGEAFIEGFARWLDGTTSLPVSVARDGERVADGKVYVAPGKRHLKVQGGQLRLVSGEPVYGQCPSGSVLFESMAHELGSRSLGVLLTGMGEDGASGLLDIKNAGGYTIAEDATTAVVYGMPGAAAKLGATEELLPLPQIAARIEELTAASKEVS